MVGDNPKVAAAIVLLLAVLVARTEPMVSPPAVQALEKRSDYHAILFMNSLLSLCSGMINGLAFLELNATIAHHTGNLTHWGRNWGTESLCFGCYLAAYLIGAGVVGYVKSDAEAVFVGRYSPSMMAGVVAVVGGTTIQLLSGNALVTLVLWSFSQGLQNAVCRKFSSMPLCSTHFTGYLTDAGNAFGAWLRAKYYGEVVPPMKKFVLFMACMFFFAGGGFIAKVGRDSYGILVAFVPAVLMAAVAIGLFPMGELSEHKD